MDLKLQIGHATDTGMRRDHNEDCLGVSRSKNGEPDPRGTILVVADGMGGYAAGEVASNLTVTTIIDSYFGFSAGGVADGLSAALKKANQVVVEAATEDTERAGMGATAAVALVLDSELFVANVGDSRVYLIHDGELQQISHDHSWVAELVAVGKITPEEAKVHPMRNVITRSIGGRPQVEIETYPPQPLVHGDVILLCSDGLWGMVPGEQIRRIIESLPPQPAADALIAAANQAGGHDNITAIVCRILGSPEDTEDDATEQVDLLEVQNTEPMPQLQL
ncbi:MAG: Stp1/IreP family PP2C-type Ser/Thr phosphatase [Chloroflexi bacterium]|nr:Stp1/IreP family PP2C-type Ser/Thr phosphatase [Chloroflexota bacterium]